MRGGIDGLPQLMHWEMVFNGQYAPDCCFKRPEKVRTCPLMPGHSRTRRLQEHDPRRCDWFPKKPWFDRANLSGKQRLSVDQLPGTISISIHVSIVETMIE